MANYANLLATIAANIYTNHNNEVTAAMVKSVEDAVVASLGAGYQFMGVAVPATDPSSPDYKCFYIASQPGTYTNFLDENADPIEVLDGEVAVLKYGADWKKEVTGAATHDEVTALGQDLSNFVSDYEDINFAVEGNKSNWLQSYIVQGRLRMPGGITLESFKRQTGSGALYKFTKNCFYIADQEVAGVKITHNSEGKLVLNGTASTTAAVVVLFPVPLSGQFYGYLKGTTTKGVTIEIRTDLSGAGSATISSNASAYFDRNVSDVTKYRLILSGGEVFEDFVVEASLEYLYNEASAQNPYYFEPATPFAEAAFPIMSDTSYFLTYLTTSQILADAKFSYGMKVVRVSKNGGGDYSSILAALKDTPDFVKVYVENGTYNIVDEYKAYYGNSFWINYAGYAGVADDFYKGLWISNHRVIEFQPWAKVVWDYDGANAEVNGKFSVFATGQNATIIGAFITFNSNCRYAIHDDAAVFGGTNTFINCVFDGTSSNGTTIGGGCGHRNTYIIKDCLFLNDGTYDISYHNNQGSGRNHLIVTGCYGSGQLKFGWYGSSTEITECIASNNTFGSVVCVAHNSSSTTENMRLYAWNNIEG